MDWTKATLIKSISSIDIVLFGGGIRPKTNLFTDIEYEIRKVSAQKFDRELDDIKIRKNLNMMESVFKRQNEQKIVLDKLYKNLQETYSNLIEIDKLEILSPFMKVILEFIQNNNLTKIIMDYLWCDKHQILPVYLPCFYCESENENNGSGHQIKLGRHLYQNCILFNLPFDLNFDNLNKTLKPNSNINLHDLHDIGYYLKGKNSGNSYNTIHINSCRYKMLNKNDQVIIGEHQISKHLELLYLCHSNNDWLRTIK